MNHQSEIHLDLHSSQRFRLAKEMYLKAILQLSNQEEVRPIDLVNCLGVSKGTVSEMVKKLDDEGYLKYESFKFIRLTSKGRKKASLLLRKYIIIRDFLKSKLHMADSNAHDEACNLEHVFSDEAIEKLEEFLHRKK